VNAGVPAQAQAADFAVRDAGERDIARIAEIYAHHVRTGLATFEVEPPDAAEMARRRESVLGWALPYFVAEDARGILGYAYAAPYRTRIGYRYTVEDSLYVDPAAVGRGVGRRLLERLIETCTERGCRQMIAVIGDRDNRASIGVHAACGFARVGLLPSTGFKFGRWVDSVLMQRDLGAGDRSPPAGGGARF
jgi:phosphinothricin acetyltransferase